LSNVLKPGQVYIKYHELGLEINGETKKISKCVFTGPLPKCEEQLFCRMALKNQKYVSDNIDSLCRPFRASSAYRDARPLSRS